MTHILQTRRQCSPCWRRYGQPPGPPRKAARTHRRRDGRTGASHGHRTSSFPSHRCGSWGRAHHDRNATWGKACSYSNGSCAKGRGEKNSIKWGNIGGRSTQVSEDFNLNDSGNYRHLKTTKQGSWGEIGAEFWNYSI